MAWWEPRPLPADLEARMWGGLKGPLEGGMAIPIEKDMGPDWMTRGLSMGGGLQGMAVPQQPRGPAPKVAEDLAVLQGELEGLDGELRGLADILKPLLTALPVDHGAVETKIPNTDGRSQVGQVVLHQAARIRELRAFVGALGRSLEL